MTQFEYNLFVYYNIQTNLEKDTKIIIMSVSYNKDKN